MQAALRILLFSTTFLALSCTQPKEEDSRPNILLIVADDLGYSDLGCFGGNIRTPNIDRLASKGIRFSRFHAGPTCAVTRAMLLSGNNNHVAGMGYQDIHLTQHPLKGTIGYEGHLSNRIVPVPALLKKAGYHTYTAGKWHLGNEDEDSPSAKGFEKSFSILQGGANHFNNTGIEPDDTLAFYRENGEPVEYPEGEYSTTVYTNKLIDYIKSGLAESHRRPFFALAAYTSPHWPLQVPEDYLDRYEGDFDMGYDSLRVIRFESLKDEGLIPTEATLPPRLENITPWDELSDEDKRIESRKMELYASMVDNLDYHVGRLIQFLKSEELYENTIVIFISDNGAAGNDLYNEAWSQDYIRARYDNSYESMGGVNSFVSYGPQWAQAGAAPFNRYKGFTTEGGTLAPFIVSGIGIPTTGEVRDDYFTVMDLAPTFYEIAGIKYPNGLSNDHTMPLLGSSILGNILSANIPIHDSNYGVGLEHRARMFYRKGDWKIVNVEGPYAENKIQLFNIASDLGETHDLRIEEPEKFNELLSEWKTFAKKSKITIQE
ncbi:MAG: arylsulfatase [Cyclobacteriaceae bacterium]